MIKEEKRVYMNLIRKFEGTGVEKEEDSCRQRGCLEAEK
jgi:hypothetical protein